MMSGSDWALEVIRGREAGRLYQIESSSTVLGNALAGSSGIDLAPQEPDSPRKMAGRQAVLDFEKQSQSMILRDLDSPGGTFVNRQRLLPGQGRNLAEGDLIQIGAVQLKVTRNRSNVKAEASYQSNLNQIINYTLSDGTTCQSWDDFLKVSSQKWPVLRDEIVSGRINAWLRSIGRTDLLAASVNISESSDDQLDKWLGKLPLTLPASPELDVHPKNLTVRVTPGGGVITRSIRVANVGHRLLNITAKIDTTGASWLKLKGGDPFTQTIVDSYDLSLEITVPDSLPKPLNAKIVIDGNGGSKHVNVSLEAKVKDSSDMPAVTGVRATDSGGLLTSIAIPLRIVALTILLMLARVVVYLADPLLPQTMTTANAQRPGLLGPAIVFFVAGAILGAVISKRRGGMGQVIYGGISGGLAFAAAAAIVVAGARAVEPILGPMGHSLIGGSLIWGIIGLVLALISARLVPFVSKHKES